MRFSRPLAALSLALLLNGCSCGLEAPSTDAGTKDAGPDDAGAVDAGAPDAGAPDAGLDDAGPVDAGSKDAGPPPDCDTPDEARTLDDCGVTVDGPAKLGGITTEGDEDWYRVSLPADVAAGRLLRLEVGYESDTPVRLSLAAHADDDLALLGARAEASGAAQSTSLVLHLGIGPDDAGSVVLVHVTDNPPDGSAGRVDLEGRYALTATLEADPDLTEPNDETPASLPLGDNGDGTYGGSAEAGLSYDGDQDRFVVDVPDLGQHAILYLALEGAPPLEGETANPVEWSLYDPDGVLVEERRASDGTSPARLATAREVSPGPHVVVVRGVSTDGAVEIVPGSPNALYQLDALAFPSRDAREANDDLSNAFVASLGTVPGESRSFEGRLDHVGDVDVYGVTVAPSIEPTVLHYLLEPPTGEALFPPLPGDEDLRLQALRPVPAGSACLDDESVCPGAPEPGSDIEARAQAWCAAEAPACLLASREPHDGGALSSFEGTLFVPPHAATQVFYFVIDRASGTRADERLHRLVVSWRADPDEAARFSGGVEVPPPRTLAEDPTGSSFPMPPAGVYEVSGVLSYGHGALDGAMAGDGVRGARDYDAVPSDVDTWLFSLPSSLVAPSDKTLELAFEVEHVDGAPPADLVLELRFCDGDDTPDGMTCTPVDTFSNGEPLRLVYDPTPVAAWHNPDAPESERQPLWSRTVGPASTSTVATPYSCTCLEPRLLRGGTLEVRVSATNRTSYANAPYSLRMAYTDYPKSYATGDGIQQCPAPSFSMNAWQPGCRFTERP